MLHREEAIAEIKKTIEKTYYKKGKAVIEQNFKAVDATLENLYEVDINQLVNGQHVSLTDVVSDLAPDFVKNITAKMMVGHGDDLPVSMMPVDGTYPSATTKWEKRNISDLVPVWDPETCIQCGN